MQLRLWHLTGLLASIHFTIFSRYLFSTSYFHPESSLRLAISLSIIQLLFNLILLTLLLQKGITCDTSLRPYRACIVLSQALGLAQGGFMFFLLITIDSKNLPESRTYDGLATYIHCAVALVYFFFLFIRALSSLGWILLRLCDAEFDREGAFTLTAAVLTALATIVTILQQQAFKPNFTCFTIWTTYCAYIVSAYLYFGGEYELNPQEKCFCLVRLVLALLQILAFQGWLFLALVFLEDSPSSLFTTNRGLLVLFCFDASLISSGFMAIMILQTRLMNISSYQLLVDKLKREFHPFSEGVLIQIAYTISQLAHFKDNLSWLNEWDTIYLALPLGSVILLLPIQWWVLLPRVNRATLSGANNLQKVKRSLLSLMIPYSVGVIITASMLCFIYLTNRECKEITILLWTWLFALVVKELLIRLKLRRIYQWYSHIMLDGDQFAMLLPLLAERRERERQTQLQAQLINITQLPLSVENEPCPICLNEMISKPTEDGNQENQSEWTTVVQIKRCGHYFHKDCIQSWVATKIACPLDRISLVDSH